MIKIIAIVIVIAMIITAWYIWGKERFTGGFDNSGLPIILNGISQPENLCASYAKQLKPVLNVAVSGEANCREVALVDSGWWPTPDYNVDIEWNSDKGDISLPGVKLIGNYTVTITDVAGNKKKTDTTLYEVPSLNVSGRDLTPTGSQTIKTSDGTTVKTSNFVAMTGQLTGRVGEVFPRVLLTYNFLNRGYVLFSYNQNKIIVYPKNENIDVGIPGPLDKWPASNAKWGLLVKLKFAIENGKFTSGWFLIDTGAIDITLMVTKKFGSSLGCYNPAKYTQTVGVAGVVCADIKRACIIDNAGNKACFPVTVEGSITGCSGCDGRIGTRLLKNLDVFSGRNSSNIISKYKLVGQYKSLECSELGEANTCTGSPCKSQLPITNISDIC